MPLHTSYASMYIPNTNHHKATGSPIKARKPVLSNNRVNQYPKGQSFQGTSFSMQRAAHCSRQNKPCLASVMTHEYPTYKTSASISWQSNT